MFKKTILSSLPFLFCVASFISLLPIWVGDLFSHFRMFWTVFSIFLFIIYLILFNKKEVDFKPAVGAFFCIIINLGSSYSYWQNSQTYTSIFFGSPTGIEYSEKIKQKIENDTTVKSLLLMNILSSNINYDEVKRTIKNTNADFVVIIELNKKWENELQELKQSYKYQFKEVREDNFGMGFYSKTKLIECISLDSAHNQLLKKQYKNKYSIEEPNLRYQANQKKLKESCIKIKNANQIAVIVAHPIPPITSKKYNRRNNYLREVSMMINESTNKTLLVGDLNCSPFSYDYQNFLKISNLKDSQENFGFQPTWNSSFPFLIQTQLDHVWHSEDIEILHRQTLPIKGSDHKAVFVVFR